MFGFEDEYSVKTGRLRRKIMFHEEEIDINYLHKWLGDSKDIFLCDPDNKEEIDRLRDFIDKIENWYNNQIGNSNVDIDR